MSWRRRYLRFLVWLRRSVRVLVWAAVAVVLLAVGALLLVTRTDPGVEFLVDEVLARVRGSIHGTLTVEDASAEDLLEGVTLRGVAIRDPSGRDFVVVDSLRARYSVLSFLRGDVVLDGVELWAPRVTVERIPGETRVNASRIFAGPPEPELDTAVAQPRAAGGRRVLLREVTIHDGEVKVLLPQEGRAPEGAFLEPAPGASKGRLRSYAFRELQAEFPRVSLVSPEREGIEGAVERLSFRGEILRKPVPLRELRGVVRIVESSVTLEAAVLRVGESDLTGRARTAWGEEGVRVTGDLRAAPLHLRDLAWLEPRLREGIVYAGVGVDRTPTSTRWRIRDGDLRVGETRVRGSGEITTGRALAFRDFEARTDSLAIADLRPWLGESIPFRGSLGGRVRLDGPPAALGVDAELTLREPGTTPTSATVTGTVDLAGARGAEELDVEVAPLDFRLLRRLAPGARLSGTGSLRLEANGGLREGLRVEAEMEHEGPGLPRSRVEAEGTVRVDSADVHLALDGEVDPLVLSALAEMVPGLKPRGEIEGPFRIRGRLGDLGVGTELQTERGRIALDVRVDARNPGAGYRVAGEVGEFEASGLLGRLPEPTVVTGSFSARGRGLDRGSVRGEASVDVRQTRMGPLRVDTADLRIRADGGMIHLDTLEARTNLARFAGGGRLGLTDDGPMGEVRLSFVNDSLASIQPFVFGDTVIAVDVLSPLEREVLRLEGVDLDTLPTSAAVALGGRLRGAMTVR
ncbi:MAG TPA: hypothetical protein VLL48_03585, partial [Longimicrobiales bacterium]|nr:hypothetical protein [Longimicrobiales bacterium]